MGCCKAQCGTCTAALCGFRFATKLRKGSWCRPAEVYMQLQKWKVRPVLPSISISIVKFLPFPWRCILSCSKPGWIVVTKAVQMLWQDTAKKQLVEMEKPNLPALEVVVAVRVAATASSPPQRKTRTRDSSIAGRRPCCWSPQLLSHWL